MKNRQFHIIIADDDLDDQFFLQQAIRCSKINHRITTVFSGEELLNLLSDDKEKTRLTDLIILDINMPLLGGIEALSKIKSDLLLERIPVVMFSSASDESSRQRCINIGASAFFTKPNDTGELDNIFEEIITNILRVLPENVA
jgi:CheY-like chemotaxis protein